MATLQNKSIWLDIQHAKYYLIPNNEELPEGKTTLITLTGRIKRVDLDAVATYEMSETEAQAAIQSKSMHFFTVVQDTLSNFFDALIPLTTKKNPQSEAKSDQQAQASIKLTATLLGISPDVLQNNPDVARLGLHNIVSQIAGVLADSISDDEARFVAAKMRVHQFRANLEVLNVHTDARLEELPDKVRKWYKSSDNQADFQKVVNMLRSSAWQFDPSSGKEPVDQVLMQLGQGFRELFEEKESPEQERERYRLQARKSIEEVCGPTKTFDFKKAWAAHQRKQ